MTGPALYSRFLDLLNGKHPIGWFADKKFEIRIAPVCVGTE